jgi:hypothetical protein
MTSRRARRGWLLALGTVLLVACGDSGQSPTAPVTPATSTSDDTVVITDEPTPVDPALQEVVDELDGLEADLDDLDVLSELVEIDQGG